MTHQENNFVIVGAGLAGVAAAGALRDAGFTGRIVVIEAESVEPYDRPPLSKDNLTAENGAAAALRPSEWYEQKQIELVLGAQATRLDIAAHQVELSTGRTQSYRKLLLASGARVRRFTALEQGALPCLYLRTHADSVELRRQLTERRRVVIIGAGVIGMEVAASAVRRGCDVTVIDIAKHVMARTLRADVSAHVADYHRAQGVKLLLGAHIDGQETRGGEHGIALRDGSFVPADVLIIGIGVTPNSELAAAAGIACNDGIVVDEYGATSAADVYAAGDVAHYPDTFLGRTLRGESWMHAEKHATSVARSMLGERNAYRHVPYMWSDQYDLKIQVAGVCHGDEHVVRGSMEANKFVTFHLSNGKVVGATAINNPRDMAAAQRCIDAGAMIAADRLADPRFNLRSAL